MADRHKRYVVMACFGTQKVFVIGSARDITDGSGRRAFLQE
ncbi:hypothetical protein EYZ11_005454 [Aspergillus tanneri]|uniref:Uncharacterized protein n=1 Tax=Aspergillus tanneri TaxID=1220188 RepID=A0A4S3JHW7_9EURO|nr:hypothetical protein EYZ11_005454 [Aspergillus tanneri]